VAWDVRHRARSSTLSGISPGCVVPRVDAMGWQRSSARFAVGVWFVVRFASGVRATGLLRRLIPEAQNVPGYTDGRRRIRASRRRWCIPEHKAAGQRRWRNQEHERAGQRRRRIQEYEAASVPSPMRATRADPGSGTIDPGGSRTGGGFGGPSPGGPSGGLPGGSFWGGGNEGPVGGPFGQGCQ